MIEHHVLPGQGVKLTAHDLRDCYALAAYTRFDHKETAPFMKFAAAMLGHSETQGALAYMAVHVDGLHRARAPRPSTQAVCPNNRHAPCWVDLLHPSNL